MEAVSNSQIGQDLWVLEKSKQKRNGFFVEAGACDGILLSNTLLLEKEYDWGGICCEPNPEYFESLIRNRSCICDNRALYNVDGDEIEFFPADEFGGTKDDFSVESKRLNSRLQYDSIKVKTVSLNNLLTTHNAPKEIDYISLDTEGSELKILESFDFETWNVAIFSIEHNSKHRDDGSKYLNDLIALLSQKGYQFEQNRWDAYFYRQ